MKKKITKKTEYDIQAEKFMAETDTAMDKEYLAHYCRFEEDGIPTAVYMITLRRGSKKPYVFKFSTSINDSYKFVTGTARLPISESKQQSTSMSLSEKRSGILYREAASAGLSREFYAPKINQQIRVKKILNNTPSDYDILACMSGYSPGTHEDFCGNFGYDEDSIKGLNIYQKVLKEYSGLSKLYNSEELDKLSEIS